MGAEVMDRTYWHVPGARSWHAGEPVQEGAQVVFPPLCNTPTMRRPRPLDYADRIPPTAHLCGNCARIIAARTDIEEDTTYGVTVAPI